jgi:hypothetical protein
MHASPAADLPVMALRMISLKNVPKSSVFHPRIYSRWETLLIEKAVLYWRLLAITDLHQLLDHREERAKVWEKDHVTREVVLELRTHDFVDYTDMF